MTNCVDSTYAGRSVTRPPLDDGKLVVIAGSPAAGTVGIVDVASGESTVIASLACEAAEKPAADGDDEPLK